MKKLILLSPMLLLAHQVLASNISDELLRLNGLSQTWLVLGFFCISLGILSSGFSLCISIGAYAGCAKEQQKNVGFVSILPSMQGIYSFAIGLIMIQNMTDLPLEVAFAGMLCGLTAFFTAIGQAKTSAACIRAVSNSQMDHGQAILLSAVPGLFALLGFLAALLLMS